MDACLAGEGVALASAVLASHALASGTLKEVVSPIALPGLRCYAARVPGGGPRGAMLVMWLRSLLTQDIVGDVSPPTVAVDAAS